MDAAEFFIHGMGKHLIQTKPVDELNYFKKRLAEAQDDFKNLFPKDLPPDEAMARRNAETHTSFHNLQMDLGIPGPNDRVYSVHFYYGKVLGCINNVLRKRANFHKRMFCELSKISWPRMLVVFKVKSTLRTRAFSLTYA